MSPFLLKWKKNRAEQARKRRRTALKAIAIGGLIVISALTIGACEGKQKLVETTYIVKEGDTLWDIGETYMAKNTGGRRYILEFMEGIKELNPELDASHGQVYVGQKLRINYFIKDDGEGGDED